MEFLRELAVVVLYLLALINPVSKISVIAASSWAGQPAEFRAIINKSSAVALAILFGTMLFGQFVFTQVFRVELHSLNVAGGIVVAWFGFNALRQGVFFEKAIEQRLSDMAIVPLACPLIAGPATIAASLTMTAAGDLRMPALAVLVALAVNHVIMLFSLPIAALLRGLNVLGALVRLTGLVVMTIGVQMVLNGLRAARAGL
ncbi:MAG: MarC family protein [Candidatus Brocadiaceae bacterium]|nr:MarC family protein [Candidatus Brocadiaceae bacterium]